MQTLSQYRTKLRSIVADDAEYVNPHFTDTKLNYYINRAISNVALDLRGYKVFSRQMFIVPSRYIDSYTIPTDYLSANSLVDVYNKDSFLPGPMQEVEILRTTYDGNIALGSRFAIDERKRKLKFLDTTELDGRSNIPITYHISAFDRTNNIITVDYAVLTYGALDKVVLTAGSAVVTMESTAQITAGDVVVGDGTIIVSNTTVLSVDSSTQITLAADVDATGAALTVRGVGAVLTNVGGKDDVKGYLKLVSSDEEDTEYTRYSKTLDNGDDTYSIIIPDWDILNTDGTVDFDGGTLVFVPYVLVYDAIPPELSADGDTCYFPSEIDYLIPLYASIESYRNEANTDMVNLQFQTYSFEKSKVLENMTGDRAILSNQETTARNKNWRGKNANIR